MPIDSHSGLPGTCDVIVVGGAMVGGTLALALAQKGFRVVLLDSRPVGHPAGRESPADPIDRRTTAMAAASASILDAWGIWPDLQAASGKIDSIHVSQRGHFGALRMNAQDLDVPSLGYVVDNYRYNALIASRLAADAHVTIVAPADITGLSESVGAIDLALDAAGTVSTVSARLLVAADGAHSAIRSRVGVGVHETDYQQSALIASVESELPNRQVAYERFTASGPLAMLPVTQHINSAIYTVDANTVQQFEGTDRSKRPALFCALLQQQFGYRLGELKRSSQPDIYPLMLRSAKRSHSGRVLLLGNALRSLHPVAGQGFNLAVRDMGKLLELLDDADTVADPGAAALLQKFADTRSRDQLVTVGATDLLARVFRGKSRTLGHVRTLGLLGLDALPPLKRAFARRAMGYGGPLPDLDYPR